MIHKSCGGSFILDMSSIVMLHSPTISISPKGVMPGILEMDFINKKSTPTLKCRKCSANPSNKEEYEQQIEENCGLCGKPKSPSEIYVTEYIPLICEDCLKGNSPESKFREPRTIQQKYYQVYGEVLRAMEHPTLLTILMKKP